MAGKAVPNFETWSVPEHSLHIEYSAAVLDEIRTAAVEGYHRVPHGGVETGGVLFGTHQRNVVRILAYLPVECAYTRGPSFLLSEAEEEALPDKIRTWHDGQQIEGLEPVGWYRTHNRSEILLAETDLSFFNRFFPEPWQIALIVRPAAFAPTRAGFFFRESGGAIRTQSSYREFVLAPLRTVVTADERRQPVESAHSTPDAAVPSPVAAPPTVEPPAPAAPLRPAPSVSDLFKAFAPPPSPPPRPRRWPWVVVAAILLLAAAAAGYRYFRPSHGLSLSVSDIGGQLRVAWDRNAPALRHATGGSLAILENGGRTEVNLTPADLRSGSIVYARRSGDVVLRLMVYVPGSQPVAEITRFVKPGEPVAPPPAEAAAPPPKPAETPPQPENNLAQASPPPVTRAPVQQPIAPKPTLPAPVAQPVPAPLKRTTAVFRAPAVRKPASSATPQLAPPPPAELGANPLAAGLPAGLDSVPAPARPPEPARVAPASGRIIWIGRLPKDGRLVIQGHHASSGAISAALPARGLMVSAYPGELTSSGMTVYTPEPKYAKPLTEAAGPENGWNRTTYTLDARRAEAIRVVQLPSPRNGYQLVLQGNSPKLAIVMLEWRAP